MVKLNTHQEDRSREEKEVNPKMNTKPNMTDTANTRKRTPGKSTESRRKNIEISLVIKMTSIMMKKDSQMLQPVGIIVANTNIHIEVINKSLLTLTSHIGNRSIILGEQFVFHVTV